MSDRDFCQKKWEVISSEIQTKGKCEEKYKYKESDYVNGGQEQDEMCFPSVDFNDVSCLLRGNRHSGVCQHLFIWPCVCVPGCLRPRWRCPHLCCDYCNYPSGTATEYIKWEQHIKKNLLLSFFLPHSLWKYISLKDFIRSVCKTIYISAFIAYGYFLFLVRNEKASFSYLSLNSYPGWKKKKKTC